MGVLVNSTPRKKEKMRKDDGITVIAIIGIVFGIICFIGLASLGWTILNVYDSGIMEPAKPQYSYNETNNSNTIETDESTEITINGKTYANEKDYINGKIDINSELVKELYSKVLKSNYIYADDFDEEYSFYKDEKVTVNNLTNTEKVIAVLQYLEENNYGTKIELAKLNQEILNRLNMYVPAELEGPVYGEVYDVNVLEKATKLIFGENIQIDGFSFTNYCAVAHDYIDGNYYHYMYPGGGGQSCEYGYSKIERVQEEGDYIYIYDKFIYADDKLNAFGFAEYFKNSSKSVSIGVAEEWDEIEIGTSDPIQINKLISKYEDKLNTYKHTFKKNVDGEYYWVSTEIEN